MATPQAVKGGVKDLASLTQFVFKNMDELFYKLDFKPNERSKAGNFDAEEISFNSTGANQVLRHRLERIPTGMLVIEKDGFCDVMIDAKDDKTITVKGSVSGVTIKIIVI